MSKLLRSVKPGATYVPYFIEYNDHFFQRNIVILNKIWHK